MRQSEFTPRATAYDDSSHDACQNSPCPTSAGCRISGNPLITSPLAPNYPASATLTEGTGGAFSKSAYNNNQHGTFKVRRVAGKEYIQRSPVVRTFEPKDTDPLMTLVFGPHAITDTAIATQTNNMAQAITVARRYLERSLGLAKKLEDNPNMQLDPIFAKYLRLIFALKVNVEEGQERFTELMPAAFIDNNCVDSDSACLLKCALGNVRSLPLQRRQSARIPAECAGSQFMRQSQAVMHFPRK